MFSNRVKRLGQQSAVRLTLSLILVFAVVTALAGVATYVLVQKEMNRMVDARLNAQADQVAQALTQQAALPDPGFGQHIAVQTGGGVQGALPFAMPTRGDGAYLFDRRGADYRVLVRTTGAGDRIIVAENVERQDELLDTLIGGLQVSLLGMLAAGILAGLWFAARAQRRVDLISAGLSDVAQGRLDAQITLPGRRDDLSLLADRINATTGRLAQSMEQMRVQSSNIAHDLRTPLARLRAHVETSLTDLVDHDRAVDADTLVAALDQIDHIVGTFNALLRLARVESGAGKAAFEDVDLGRLTHEVAETFAPVIEDAGQRLSVEVTAPAVVRGDRDLLVQLLANLIQNALRYGAAGQVVRLMVHGAVVAVVDQGPGIPLDARDKVREPLYQIEDTRQGTGYGLGLSMVAAISALHDATLSLTDGDGGRGLAVTVRFPTLTKL
ncbi:HAMP domain-containing sensor histidine kinase [uncultured Tateyamaria sp.]|uniref:sensor histidine kinase n=1 Tax=uncultured Tateyamaria sp. TaxID=455651 RepID=UPI0026166711|nr:HAMP domain-containing sensor histidine kinase [uncultured Tateyamaria sp.]